MISITNKAAAHFLSALFFLLLIFNSVLAHAQEEAPESKYSLRAPKNIKVDGKATEWDDKLKAYSHHTQFYYAVSNDDRYLYLTIQATDDLIINRILKGGITFTINKTDKRKDPNAVHVTYPVLTSYYAIRDLPKLKDRSPANLAAIDTFVNEANDRIAQMAKTITVLGIKGVDTLTSIYNLDGIKAAALLDTKLHYTCEIAVALKNLGLSVNQPLKFMYQVMINEVEPKTSKGKTADGIAWEITSPRLDGQFATDFWGQYTLAK